MRFYSGFRLAVNQLNSQKTFPHQYSRSLRLYHSDDSKKLNSENKKNDKGNENQDTEFTCSKCNETQKIPQSQSSSRAHFQNTNPDLNSSTDKPNSSIPETHLTITNPRRTSLEEYKSGGVPNTHPSNTVSSGATKQEFLATAKGKIGRLFIHLRWALFKQIRPLTTDDLSALFSWILVGNIIWILLGTTTFFSLILLAINTVFAQEYIAEVIGNFVTKNTGITVVFENAIVPHWSDGVISFNKVFVSKRPNRGNQRVQKGSQAAAAADAAASSSSDLIPDSNSNLSPESTSDLSPDPSTDSSSPSMFKEPITYFKSLFKSDTNSSSTSTSRTDNYTQFDLTIDTVSVTLSLSKWMNGGGIIKDLEVSGLRGIVDRRHVQFDPSYDPSINKNIHKPGDFEIDNFKMEDALVTLYHPENFRPFRVSVFSCELPRLRKHWLFYDILSATKMTGTYDDSLFTIHPRQLEHVTNFEETGILLGNDSGDGDSGENGETRKSAWKKINRLRIDGVNIDHLNRGVQEGPLSWIESGTVDLCADIMFPAEDKNLNFAQVLRDIQASWSRISPNGDRNSYGGENDENDERSNFTFQDGEWKKKVIHAETKTLLSFNKDPNTLLPENKYMVIDLRVQLNNCKAIVPLFTSGLTYINNALIRPIVAYINANNTYIPIDCRIIKKYSDFEGAWTMFDSKLVDDISAAVYDAFAKSVLNDEDRAMRMRKVGFWSLQLMLQFFLVSLGALA